MSKIPTIAMIPSAYKANKVYSVLPTNGDADLDFARTSTRTRVNEIGLIEDLATGVPALDYSDGGCPSLILEPQSTNLITYSEDFSDSSWLKQFGGVSSAPVVSSNYSISPNGMQNADRLIFDLNGGTTSSDFSQLQADTSLTISQNHTTSIYLKSNTIDSYEMYFIDVAGIGRAITVTNEWKRFEISANASVNSIRLRLRGSEPTSSYADILIWGAQLEELSYATSYIPTSGATATRVAETLSKTGLSDYINSIEGVLYLEISALANDGTFREISLSDGTTNNRIEVRFNTVLNQIETIVRNVSGVVQNNLFHTLSNAKAFNKIAFKYKQNDFALFVNGVKVGTDFSGTTFSQSTLNRLGFDSGNGGSPFYGKVKDLRVYNQALTDTELQNLTS